MFHFMGSAHSIAPFGLGQVAVQNANFGVVAGVSALGTEAVRQEGAGLSIALCRSRRVLGALVVDVPPLF